MDWPWSGFNASASPASELPGGGGGRRLQRQEPDLPDHYHTGGVVGLVLVRALTHELFTLFLFTSATPRLCSQTKTVVTRKIKHLQKCFRGGYM